jgi:hypothetical protein
MGYWRQDGENLGGRYRRGRIARLPKEVLSSDALTNIHLQ